ncbi:MAG: hypothetical protein ABH885_07745 [Candidatus Omnitrophota bacterium]
MNRKMLLAPVAICLFVFSAFVPRAGSDGPQGLNPLTRFGVDTGRIETYQLYDILCMGLLIYRLDAVERCAKDVVKESIMRDYDSAFFNLSGVRFDLESIDIAKKGWTRYYPFVIGERQYVMRIFRADEKQFQPEIKILHEGTVRMRGLVEGSFRTTSVTFQIIPGVNDLLDRLRVKTFDLGPIIQTSSSP